MRRLLFSSQSPDERIDRKLRFGVRVVTAIAARTAALLAGAHVIAGQMMAPEPAQLSDAGGANVAKLVQLHGDVLAKRLSCVCLRTPTDADAVAI